MDSHEDQHDPHAPAQGGHHDEIPTDLPKVKTGAVVVASVVVVIAFAALFALGWFPREHRMDEAKKDVDDQSSSPVVDVVQPQRKMEGADVRLPVDLRAMQETAIYPRATGYLKSWKVDIGATVKVGDLLAEIDEPEVDAQLNQTKAQLEQSKANVIKAEADLNLAKVTLQRYTDAVKNSPGAVTAQDVDEKRAAYDDAASALKQVQASVIAGEAEVQRLETLQGFERVTAPFDGIVTARNYDVGALLSSTNTAPGAEIFRLQETDVLRGFVNVPQAYVTTIKIGQKGYLNVRNYAGKEFEGAIVKSTGALDPTTRTLKYEVDFPNKDGALYAGMYGQVRLPISLAEPPMVVPTSAVVFDADGTKVGIVEDNKLRYRKVELGRDFGTEVEVATGLDGSEQVITNPGLRLVEGGDVKVNSQSTANSGNSQSKQQLSQR
jgi:RND family efflux transporter MFP subunit